MTRRFFHALEPGECRYITGTAPLIIGRYGVAHHLATACAAPQAPGSAYCAHHLGLTRAPAAPRMAPPRETNRIASAPRAEREPDLTEIVGAA